MHMSCQHENFLSKQAPKPSPSKWSTRADALNVNFLATRGTGVRVGRTVVTTSTPRKSEGRAQSISGFP